MDTTNEPVAWIPKDHLKEMGKAGFRYTGVSYQEDKFYDIPLYTRPHSEESVKVKELTLTEDEIDDVWAACSTGESDTIDMHLFAEAILKKAQEK